MSIYNKPDISKVNNYVSPYFNANNYSNTNIIDTTFSNLHVQNELTLTNPIYYPLYAPITYNENQIGYTITADIFNKDASNQLTIQSTNYVKVSNALTLPCYGIWFLNASLLYNQTNPTGGSQVNLVSITIAKDQGTTSPAYTPENDTIATNQMNFAMNNGGGTMIETYNVSCMYSPASSFPISVYFRCATSVQSQYPNPFITYSTGNQNTTGYGFFSNSIFYATRIA